MNRHCLDPRVFGPLAAAALAFALRPLPAPAAPPGHAARSVALPELHAAPEPTGDADHVLDGERSTVRFLVTTGGRERLVACRRVAGSLRRASPGHHQELELRLDLASLQAADDSATGLDLWHLLGVHRGGEVVYRARLLRTATSNLPGVGARLWLGTLRLGDRVVQQPMELWQVALPGQPLRLQGHGSVAAHAYGLPVRSWLGLAPQTHVVTLGLDLVWRRQRRR
ncbi:MAG: hypothetical protein KF830_09850 [Planctomycetes bacterium]|nr:hypothetical protein [Planctomycetota bacterium]